MNHSRMSLPALTLTFILTLAPAPVVSAAPDSVGNAQLTPAHHSRLLAACARVPKLLTRVDNLTQRLPAGPDTPGSIARIRDRANKANEKGRTQVAVGLNKRADALTQKLATLPNQKATLLRLQTKCQQLGVSK